jgi:hypothetical protein
MNKPVRITLGARSGQIEFIEFRLRQALALYIKDGTEVHGEINIALDPVRDLRAFTTLRSSIRRAIEREYRGTVHVDDVIEVVLGLLEDGRLQENEFQQASEEVSAQAE